MNEPLINGYQLWEIISQSLVASNSRISLIRTKIGQKSEIPMIKTYTKKKIGKLKSKHQKFIGQPVFELLKGIKSSTVNVERIRINDSCFLQ